MIRTTVIPDNTNIHLSIPEDYVGREIEITCLPLEELNKQPKPSKTMKDFWGVISDGTANKFHEHIVTSREEWERSI